LIVSEEAVGNLIQKVTEEAGIAVLALLEGALQVFNLTLGQLVGDLTSIPLA